MQIRKFRILVSQLGESKKEHNHRITFNNETNKYDYCCDEYSVVIRLDHAMNCSNGHCNGHEAIIED